MRLFLASSVVLTAVATAMAQSDIDPAHKHAWAENIGWLNWRDAGDPVGSQGVVVHETFLSGFVWAENAGWINFGDGVPSDGVEYANADGTDFGVNLDPGTGDLYGMAWGENIGWVNFEGGAFAEPAAPALLDADDCRFSGYAWGENVGWLNLGLMDQFVALSSDACEGGAGGDCEAHDWDFDHDGDVDLSDFSEFALCFGGPNLPQASSCGPGIDADCDGDGDVDLNDFSGFITRFTGPL